MGEIHLINEFDGKFVDETTFSGKDGDRFQYCALYGVFFICDDHAVKVIKFEYVEQQYYSDRQEVDDNYIHTVKSINGGTIRSCSVSGNGKFVALILGDRVLIFESSLIASNEVQELDGNELASLSYSTKHDSLPVLAWKEHNGIDHVVVGLCDGLAIGNLSSKQFQAVDVKGTTALDASSTDDEIVVVTKDQLIFVSASSPKVKGKVQIPCSDAIGCTNFIRYISKNAFVCGYHSDTMEHAQLFALEVDKTSFTTPKIISLRRQPCTTLEIEDNKPTYPNRFRAVYLPNRNQLVVSNNYSDEIALVEFTFDAANHLDMATYREAADGNTLSITNDDYDGAYCEGIVVSPNSTFQPQVGDRDVPPCPMIFVLGEGGYLVCRAFYDSRFEGEHMVPIESIPSWTAGASALTVDLTAILTASGTTPASAKTVITSTGATAATAAVPPPVVASFSFAAPAPLTAPLGPTFGLPPSAAASVKSSFATDVTAVPPAVKAPSAFTFSTPTPAPFAAPLGPGFSVPPLASAPTPSVPPESLYSLPPAPGFGVPALSSMKSLVGDTDTKGPFTTAASREPTVTAPAAPAAAKGPAAATEIPSAATVVANFTSDMSIEAINDMLHQFSRVFESTAAAMDTSIQQIVDQTKDMDAHYSERHELWLKLSGDVHSLKESTMTTERDARVLKSAYAANGQRFQHLTPDLNRGLSLKLEKQRDDTIHKLAELQHKLQEASSKFNVGSFRNEEELLSAIALVEEKSKVAVDKAVQMEKAAEEEMVHQAATYGRSTSSRGQVVRLQRCVWKNAGDKLRTELAIAPPSEGNKQMDTQKTVLKHLTPSASKKQGPFAGKFPLWHSVQSNRPPKRTPTASTTTTVDRPALSKPSAAESETGPSLRGMYSRQNSILDVPIPTSKVSGPSLSPFGSTAVTGPALTAAGDKPTAAFGAAPSTAAGNKAPFAFGPAQTAADDKPAAAFGAAPTAAAGDKAPFAFGPAQTAGGDKPAALFGPALTAAGDKPTAAFGAAPTIPTAASGTFSFAKPVDKAAADGSQPPIPSAAPGAFSFGAAAPVAAAAKPTEKAKSVDSTQPPIPAAAPGTFSFGTTAKVADKTKAADSSQPPIASAAPAAFGFSAAAGPAAAAATTTTTKAADKPTTFDSSQPPIPAAAPGAFAFGAAAKPADKPKADSSQPPIPAAAPGAFAFGATAKPADKPKADSTQPPIPAAAPSTFAFGAAAKPADKPKTDSTQPPIPAAAPSTFAFGAAAKPADKPKADSTQPPIPAAAPSTFAFGATAKPADKPKADSTQPPIPAAAPGAFAFGAAAKPADKPKTDSTQPPIPAAPPGAFAFGAAAKPADKPKTDSTQPPIPAAAPGAFAFGAAAKPADKPKTDSTQPPIPAAAPGAFAFGAAAKPADKPKADSTQPPVPFAAPMAFGVGAQPAAAPFKPASNASAPASQPPVSAGAPGTGTAVFGVGTSTQPANSLFGKAAADPTPFSAAPAAVAPSTSLFGGSSGAAAPAAGFGKGFGASPVAASSSSSVLTPPSKPLFQASKGSFLGASPNAASSAFGGSASSSNMYQKQLEELYTKYNPGKINEIPSLLEKYKGRESELLQRIRAKYESNAGTASPALGGLGLGGNTFATPPRNAAPTGGFAAPSMAAAAAPTMNFGLGATAAAPASTGGFGASGFGQSSATTGGFGAGGFGQSSGATSGFGAGGFGQSSAATGSAGGFGQPSAATGGFGAGGFGQSSAPGGTGAAGGVGAATSGFGAGFGQTANLGGGTTPFGAGFGAPSTLGGSAPWGAKK